MIQSKRPETGWAYRYVKAIFSIISKKEQDMWMNSLENFQESLQRYIATHAFSEANKRKKRDLLSEFSDIWKLPYCKGILQTFHHYSRLSELNEFFIAFKRYYQKERNFYVVDITTPKNLTRECIERLLQALGLAIEKTSVSQRIEPRLYGGLIIESNYYRYDGSFSSVCKKIKRSLTL